MPTRSSSSAPGTPVTDTPAPDTLAAGESVPSAPLEGAAAPAPAWDAIDHVVEAWWAEAKFRFAGAETELHNRMHDLKDDLKRRLRAAGAALIS
jgi:hypothetical protein